MPDDRENGHAARAHRGGRAVPFRTGRRLDKLPYQVWVLCGDSEMAEGSMWEALDKAAYYKLGNLTAIIDVNRLGQRGPTELEWDMDAYRRRAEAFGCTAVVFDGHDIGQIDRALASARDTARPTVVLARAVKGKGFAEVEDKNGWHGRPLPAEIPQREVAALGGERNLHVTAPPRASRHPAASRGPGGDPAALRNIPDRFFEMFIAEQQLIAVAVGLAVRGNVPFASTFAAFVSRGYDFLRMAGITGANIKLCGSHAGVEISPDGPSQMALEDLAALRAIHGSTVLYPADAAAALTAEMADTPGIVYLRTTRAPGPSCIPPGRPSRSAAARYCAQDPATRSR